jgi:hypothetical protein
LPEQPQAAVVGHPDVLPVVVPPVVAPDEWEGLELPGEVAFFLQPRITQVRSRIKPMTKLVMERNAFINFRF